MDFTTNYCGAYWNNGQIRSSKKRYNALPVNELDKHCLAHDCDLAIIETEYDADAEMMSRADKKFHDNVSQLKGIRPYIYSKLVYYGNPLLRMGATYAKGAQQFMDLDRTAGLRGANNGDVSQKQDTSSGEYACQPLDNFVLRGSSGTYNPQPYTPVGDIVSSNGQLVKPSASESAGIGYRIRKNIPFTLNTYGKRKRKRKKNKKKH